MAFWGIEVKPGKPYTHRFDNERGSLHLSQATLGSGSSSKKSILQCNVGDKSPIYLCSLLPERIETSQLNLEFEEDDEVVFSVIGPHSIHLSGFFCGETKDSTTDDNESDSYGEDIADESSDESSDFDIEDEYDHDFIVDDMDMYQPYPPSPVPNSGVVIEEILDDDKPANGNGMSKRGKKNQSRNSNVNAKSGTSAPMLESEDEDGFPISSSQKGKTDALSNDGKAKENKEKRTHLEAKKKKAENDLGHGKSLKRKVEAIAQNGEQVRETGQQGNSSVENDVVPDTDVKQKKKNKNKNKKKKVKGEGNTLEAGTGSKINDQSEVAIMDKGEEQDQKLTTEKNLDNVADGKKKNNKKKKSKKQGGDVDANVDPSVVDKNELQSSRDADDEAEAKPFKVRTFPNGLVIEKLAMGKADGKKASPGKQVSVHYIGKLKKNGKIFDSNIGRAPFKFRLGIGEVIAGWDVGVNGMHVGDKRRLTIPPAMGYGTQGAAGSIPPNSWLVFDVELVDVR